MKIFLLTFLFVFSSYAEGALTPPKPVEGFPSILSKTLSTNAGDSEFTIEIPTGWGVGDMSTRADGSGKFSLFPTEGGVGCQILVKRYADLSAANQALEEAKQGLSATKALQNGFEAEFPKSWLSCRTNGFHFIKIWYSVPKKTREHAKNWEKLKSCLSAVYEDRSFAKPTSKEFKPITKAIDGWWFNHPKKPFHVFLKSTPIFKSKINETGQGSYQASFDDFQREGLFYLKWDQENLDQSYVYEAFLKEMVQDVTGRLPQQTVDPIQYELASGYTRWAFCPGKPYNFLVVEGDGFLFGFAFKTKSIFTTKVGDLADLVKWAWEK